MRCTLYAPASRARRPNSVGLGSQNHYYTYDLLGQLTAEGSGGSVDDINAFTYDSAGNRLSDKQYSLYHYNSDGRLTSKVGGGGSCTVTYSYDNSGNEVSETPGLCSEAPHRTLEYDEMERLTATTTGQLDQNGAPYDARREFWYDGEGKLVAVNSLDSRSSDAGITRYWWLDGNIAVKVFNPYGHLDDTTPILTRESSGGLNEWGEWYFNGPGVNNVLGSLNYSGTHLRHLFVKDTHGTIVRVQNPDAGTSSAADYDAFGTPGGDAEAQAGPGYTGAPSIGGLVYLRNRWYDPNNGRFTQEDPTGYGGGSNLYAYAGNNPAMFTDPFGLCEPSDAFCERMRDFLKDNGGKEGATIAGKLDDNSWKLNLTAHPLGPTGKEAAGVTHLDSHVIDVHSGASFPQQVGIVVHEFANHALPGTPDHPTVPTDPRAQFEAQTLSNMRGAPGVKNGTFRDFIVDVAASLMGIKLPPLNSDGYPRSQQ